MVSSNGLGLPPTELPRYIAGTSPLEPFREPIVKGLILSTDPYLSVVLPAFNEAAAIRRTLEAIRAFLDRQSYSYQVIVAADGDDETPEIVQQFASGWPELQLTAERGRYGKGHGVKRGMALANGQIVGFLDADYKTPIDEITKFIPLFGEGYDLVVGSRALSDSRIGQRQPWYRQVGSRGFAVCMHAIVGLHHIRDTQCGFKFFTRDAARRIFALMRIDGYMCDVEILWLAERLGLRVKEVGISWRDDGDSRLTTHIWKCTQRNRPDTDPTRLIPNNWPSQRNLRERPVAEYTASLAGGGNIMLHRSDLYDGAVPSLTPTPDRGGSLKSRG